MYILDFTTIRHHLLQQYMLLNSFFKYKDGFLNKRMYDFN